MHYYSLCALLFCLLTLSNTFYTSFCCGVYCRLSIKHFLRSIVFVMFKANTMYLYIPYSLNYALAQQQIFFSSHII
ncbi:MAG: hypothetical protein J3R72DRAFT_464086, partial [Linnemannia gamsii]